MHFEPGFVMILALHLASGTDYLVGLPKKALISNRLSIWATADETGVTLQYYALTYGWRRSVDIKPWKSAITNLYSILGTLGEFEYDAFMITSSHNAAPVAVYTNYMSFVPLPTTALGTKYIVSSCYQPGYFSLLLIAAYDETTTVSIEARSEIFGPSFSRKNKHTFELKPFQTFTFEYKSDLSGTIVTSTKPVAVLSGMTDSTNVEAFDQLLPVRLFDQEYVVAVNRGYTYSLQILSEQRNTTLTFNDGDSLIIKDNWYQQYLKQEIFFFTSSNPVMTTICRRDGIRSGFIVVPPVSLYSMRTVNLNGGYNIFITLNNTKISPSDISWTNIPNSGYKTGVLATGTLTTKAHGCNILYGITSFRTEGFTYTQTKGIEVRESFLVALPDVTSKHEAYLQLSSSQGATYQVVFPNQKQTQTRQILTTSSDNFYIKGNMKVKAGVQNKGIRVDVDSSDIQLSFVIESESGNYDWHFSIFPTSLHGREYIVQTCHGNTQTELNLTIVSSSSNTDISVRLSHGITYGGVEYKPGNTIRVNLQPYQTLTINSAVALCGTSVSASNDVAVFVHSRSGEMASYYQLLPVKNFGQTSIITANNEAISLKTEYYMLVTSAAYLTEVTFNNDLKVTLGNRKSYRKDLGRNESVFFTSTKPVLTSLCSVRCTVIIPTELYATESVFEVRGATVLHILTDRVHAQVHLTWSPKNGNYPKLFTNIKWDMYTDYKIGTARVDQGQVVISSSHRYTTLAFSIWSIGKSEGVIWNPSGWTRQPDENRTAEVDSTTSANYVNTPAIAIGISLGILILILILILLACLMCQRRRTESDLDNQPQARDRQNVSIDLPSELPLTEASLNRSLSRDPGRI